MDNVTVKLTNVKMRNYWSPGHARAMWEIIRECDYRMYDAIRKLSEIMPGAKGVECSDFGPEGKEINYMYVDMYDPDKPTVALDENGNYVIIPRGINSMYNLP